MRYRTGLVPNSVKVENFEITEEKKEEETMQMSDVKTLEVARPLHAFDALRLERRVDGQLWATTALWPPW